MVPTEGMLALQHSAGQHCRKCDGPTCWWRSLYRFRSLRIDSRRRVGFLELPFLRSRSYTEGAPAKHQSAITGSQMAHPNEESAANGTMGFWHLILLRRSRIRRSQYLLEATTHSIERISRQVGFNSPSSFRGQFKAMVGTSPRPTDTPSRDPTRPSTEMAEG